MPNSRPYKPRLGQRDEVRYREMSAFEIEAKTDGYTAVAGIDEAGRGPLAGPVAAAAVILNPEQPIIGLNDSKQLSAKKRLWLENEIKAKALAYSVAFVDASRIDEINILAATKEAMTQAVEELEPLPDYLLLDAVFLPGINQPQKSLIKGDCKSNSIAAASILAKTARDRFMEEADKTYPGYSFAQNKGYGTAAHYSALEKLGLCPLHRLSFLKKIKAGASRTTPAKNKGQTAEQRVAAHLQRQGYKILERNFLLAPFAEADLILSKSNYLYVVEVKARSGPAAETAALAAIDPSKVSKLRLLASYYAESRGFSDHTIVLLAALCQLDSQGKVERIKYLEID
ncbi:MAG: ribonuclease HII [Eubacteriales bacterium]|nr:ribonuclease HII [Eubacteriales bacterium]